MNLFERVFGTHSSRELKLIQPKVDKILSLQETMAAMSDEDLKAQTGKFKERLSQGESLDDLLPEAYATVREAAKRVLGMEHFPVQLIGGVVLHQGRIAEMKTGEGKTLVSTCPAYLNALTGEGVHIVTVNDYLAKRDSDWMGQVHRFLGLTVGTVLNEMSTEERQAAYACDITYVTNNELGFDYLRDNMAIYKNQQVLRGLTYCIIDEVDSVLIDEARTPLIISGQSGKSTKLYELCDILARQLERGEESAEFSKINAILGEEIEASGNLTQQGVEKVEKYFHIDNLADAENLEIQHNIILALRANNLMQRDVDYVVKDDEVLIVDEFTGRIMNGRRYSDGLHQAIEAKEHVKVKRESRTLATITFQNFFNKFKKKAGMTGTAQTEEKEFRNIYSMDVIQIPPNKPVQRKDLDDAVYKSKKEKFEAVVDEIEAIHETGAPVLVGTIAIETSELLSGMLKRRGIKHNVLNAKFHEQEAAIIAEAGVHGAVTIATNMAGRGTDIKLDEEARAAGGLHIVGTERHESRRIDNQLRGRSGRQGDPGESRFFLSLEDNLLRIFGSDKIKNIMDRLGLKDGEHIESGMVSRAVENAQKKVESLHFEARKNILEYDDVANEQRKTIYKYRNELLDPDYDLKDKIIQNREEYISSVLEELEIFDGANIKEVDKFPIVAKIAQETGEVLENSELEKVDDFKELKEKIVGALAVSYENKMAPIDPQQRKSIEKMLYLQIVDRDWREHLYQMDILKAGIGLRGYNHKDPLTEYKKESYNLFMELVMRLKSDSIRLLHSIQFKSREEIEAEQRAMQERMESSNAKELAAASTNEAQLNGAEEFGDKKPKRNDPCPCGSGKKYKDCHGKGGPKKGGFAR